MQALEVVSSATAYFQERKHFFSGKGQLSDQCLSAKQKTPSAEVINSGVGLIIGNDVGLLFGGFLSELIS